MFRVAWKLKIMIKKNTSGLSPFRKTGNRNFLTSDTKGSNINSV